VNLSEAYEFSTPGTYTVYWGCKNVAWSSFTLTVIDLEPEPVNR
jgi:hypothetical protein